jgi:hypothetical protein
MSHVFLFGLPRFNRLFTGPVSFIQSPHFCPSPEPAPVGLVSGHRLQCEGEPAAALLRISHLPVAQKLPCPRMAIVSVTCRAFHEQYRGCWPAVAQRASYAARGTLSGCCTNKRLGLAGVWTNYRESCDHAIGSRSQDSQGN